MSVRGVKPKKGQQAPRDGVEVQAASPWRSPPPIVVADAHYDAVVMLRCNCCRGRHPPQLQQMHIASAELPLGLGAFNGTFPSQFLWAGSSSANPMSLTSNSPFYYNQVLLSHLFPSGSRSLNMNDTNGCISWMDNGLWEVGARGTDHSTQRHCS